MSSRSQAWLFWLSHAKSIQKVSVKFASESRLDYDDFKQELVLRLVAKHDTYDQSRCKPISWLWWQAKAIRNSLLQKRAKHFVGLSEDVAITNSITGDSGCGQNRIEAIVAVRAVRALATQSQWDAVTAKTAGITENETQEVLGCHPATARRRVARLARRLEA